MDNIKVRVINKSKTLELPKYATEMSAGFDLMACFDCGVNSIIYKRDLGKLELSPRVDDEIILFRGDRVCIPTGLFMSLPEGFELQVRPRSGLALKNGITVLNTPGTVDADYRGSVGVILINNGYDEYHIHHGDRIAQGIITRFTKCVWSQVEELDETDRGEGGFGHSGI